MTMPDRIASASFVFVGLATGVVAMAVPLLFEVSKNLAWWLFWGGLLVAVVSLLVGLIALFRPAATSAPVPDTDQRVTSYGQSGGVTARTVNLSDEQE